MRKCVESYKAVRMGTTDATPKYYVYEYVNPITNNTFYVGKGQRNRRFVHLNETRRGILPNNNNGKLFREIKSLLDNGQEPIISIVADGLPEIDALAVEAACIDYHGLENLCNYQQSGIGASPHTAESKRRLSEIVRTAMDTPERKAKSRTGAYITNAKKFGGFGNYFERLASKSSPKIQRPPINKTREIAAAPDESVPKWFVDRKGQFVLS